MLDADSKLISALFLAESVSYSVEKHGGWTLDKRAALSTTICVKMKTGISYFYISDFGDDVVQLKLVQSDTERHNKPEYREVFSSTEYDIDCIDLMHRLYHEDPIQDRIFYGVDLVCRGRIVRIRLSQEAPTLFEVSTEFSEK